MIYHGFTTVWICISSGAGLAINMSDIFGGPKGALKATVFNEGMAFEHFDNDDGFLQKQN